MESRGGPGVFIVVEGPEGAGKSTLARWPGAGLVAEGPRVVPVPEPGGTPGAEAARQGALKFPHWMSPAAELILFLAARGGASGRDGAEAIRAGRRLARGRGGDWAVITGGLMMVRNVVIVSAAAGLALATGGWFLQREAEPSGSVYQQACLFEDVLAHV